MADDMKVCNKKQIVIATQCLIRSGGSMMMMMMMRFMRGADASVQSFRGQEEARKKMPRNDENLLPVGKDLVKEDSGSDRGAPQGSDSERPTVFRRGQNRSGQVN